MCECLHRAFWLTVWWQIVGHSDPSGLWYTGRHGKHNTGTAVLYIATTSLLAVWCWPLVLSGVIWNQEQGVNRATCLSSGAFDMLGEPVKLAKNYTAKNVTIKNQPV